MTLLRKQVLFIHFDAVRMRLW